MIRRLIRLVVVTALLLSVGGHWALIQSAAWAGMFLSFAKQGSLHSAVIKTFDGKHPCQLCQWVDHEQKKESKPSSKKSESKVELQLFAEELPWLVIHRIDQPNHPVCWEIKGMSRSEQPRHSPPRIA